MLVHNTTFRQINTHACSDRNFTRGNHTGSKINDEWTVVPGWHTDRNRIGAQSTARAPERHSTPSVPCTAAIGDDTDTPRTCRLLRIFTESTNMPGIDKTHSAGIRSLCLLNRPFHRLSSGVVSKTVPPVNTEGICGFVGHPWFSGRLSSPT